MGPPFLQRGKWKTRRRRRRRRSSNHVKLSGGGGRGGDFASLRWRSLPQFPDSGTNLSAAIGVFSSTRRLSVRLQKFFCIVCGKWYRSRLRPFPSKSSGMVLGSRWLSPGVGRSRAGLSCENCKRCRDRQFFFLPSSPHTNSAAKPCQRPRFLQFLILFCLLPHCQSFV